MSRILENLFVGGLEAAQDWDFICKNNIKYILNATKDPGSYVVTGIPNYYESNPNVTYKRCPLDDDLGTEIKSKLPECIEFIKEGRKHGSVLVHCAAGVSRSVSIVTAYLMSEYNMSFNEALGHVRTNRIGAYPNPNFQEQLQEWAKDLVSKQN